MASSQYVSLPVRTVRAASGTSNPGSLATSNVWSCLVLSEDAERRRLLEEGASKAGWGPRGCSSVGEAMKLHSRWRTQLSVLDLAADNTVGRAAFLRFAAMVASRDRLLLVSDASPNGEAELAARQVGAWVYLPTPTSVEGLTELFVEARNAAEKLTGTPQGPVRPTPQPASKEG